MFFPFFVSDGHLCFSLIFFVILLAGRVSVCASTHVRMCSLCPQKKLAKSVHNPHFIAGCCLQSCQNIRQSVMPPKSLTRRGGAHSVAVSTTHPANVAAAAAKKAAGGGKTHPANVVAATAAKKTARGGNAI